MTPRLRRLGADYQRITTAFSGHPYIQVEPLGPVPPDRYRVIYWLTGVHQDRDGALQRVDQHVVEVMLQGGYPREKPYCTTTSPIFHPNFGNYVCIADFWSPGQALVDVVLQIGDMIQYKLYNTSSPLNALAARWAVQNIASLPVGGKELVPLEPEISLGATANPGLANGSDSDGHGQSQDQAAGREPALPPADGGQQSEPGPRSAQPEAVPAPTQPEPSPAATHPEASPPAVEPEPLPVSVPPVPAPAEDGATCRACGAQWTGTRFCTQCGQRGE